MSKDTANYVEQIFNVTIVKRGDSGFEKVRSFAQLNHVPAVGDFLTTGVEHKVYKIEALIHSDIEMYILVSDLPDDHEYQNIFPLL